MTPRLPYLNLFGVLVLAGLCVLQWQHDRHLNLTLNRSEQARLERDAKLTDQANKIKRLNEDLAQFKTSLMDEQKQRLLAETKLQAADSTNGLLTLKCAQLQESITNWVNAVTVRDEHIQEANHRIEQLSSNLNASILKFNTLVTNYNATVENLNALRTNSTTNTSSQ